jgi:hypothetical protein
MVDSRTSITTYHFASCLTNLADLNFSGIQDRWAFVVILI